MLSGVANSHFFNLSTVRMLVLLMGLQKGMLMLGGVRLFRPSHARWRCHIQFVQTLYGQDARVAHILLLPMFGGVAIFKN